jgi:tetratricopeptide (TPR) repeat protein
MTLHKFLTLSILLFSINVVIGQSSDYSKNYNDAVRLMGSQKYDDAIVFLDQAVAAKSDYAEALFARGQCFLMLGRREEACRDFYLSKAANWKASNEYLEKYCGEESPGRHQTPINIKK